MHQLTILSLIILTDDIIIVNELSTGRIDPIKQLLKGTQI